MSKEGRGWNEGKYKRDGLKKEGQGERRERVGEDVEKV